MQCNGQRKRCAQRWAGVACKQREDALGQIVQHDGGRCHHSAAQRAGLMAGVPRAACPSGRAASSFFHRGCTAPAAERSAFPSRTSWQRPAPPNSAHGIGIGLDGMRQHVGERHRKHHAPGKPHGKRHHPRPRAFEQQNHKPPSPVERPASVVSVSANSINISPFPPSICGSRAVSAPGGRGFPAWRGSYSSAVTPFTSTPSTMAAISRGGDGHLFLQPALQHADAAGYDEGIYIIIGVPPVAAELRAPFVQHAQAHNILDLFPERPYRRCGTAAPGTCPHCRPAAQTCCTWPGWAWPLPAPTAPSGRPARARTPPAARPRCCAEAGTRSC